MITHGKNSFAERSKILTGLADQKSILNCQDNRMLKLVAEFLFIIFKVPTKLF